MRLRRLRFTREVSYDEVIDGNIAKVLVKNTSQIAYSPSLYIEEKEETQRAQQELDQWKYRGKFPLLTSYDISLPT